MGASTSKPREGTTEDLIDGNTPSTPIVNPLIRRLELDPRSPSIGIVRTPIEVLKTPVTDASDDKKIHNEDIDFDPRSPTTEFYRTPINIDHILTKPLHNKLLDNARQPLTTVTPIKSRISEKLIRRLHEDVSGTVSPKLLESNTISITKPKENKRNSIVGLLETNMDFVETDLDAVIQTKLSPVADLSSKTKPLEIQTKIEEFNSGLVDENDLLVAVSEVVQNETEKCISPPAVVDLNDSKVQVEELDKKLTHLIYEDQENEESPRVVKAITKFRPPLGDRNSNSQQRKSIPTLRVSDKPTKNFGSASKIPVYKNKNGKGKIDNEIQCENIPPKLKPKQSQWSTEDSLVI